MALLKCKMCGGAMDYDKKKDLAICPYCGNQTTVFDNDRRLYEQFQTAFAAVLDLEDVEKRREAEEGFWVECSKERLPRDDGEDIEISYLTKRRSDLCTVYVAKKNVIFVFERGQRDAADRYIEMVQNLTYPNEEMTERLSVYFPKVVTRCRLADGRDFIAIEKAEGVYPLGMLGTFIDRHVAWMMSRLENLCCVLEFNEMVLNAFTIENLFVDPANHQLYLYGGWWFAGYQGAETKGASKAVIPYLPKDRLGKSRNDILSDLESIRLVGAKLLGCDDREELKDLKALPQPFRLFLENPPKDSATKDFAEWDRVLTASYGERKFIPFSVTDEEVYSKSADEYTV